MYYIRGNRAEFDAWEALGDDDWNWHTLFPYFVHSENFSIPSTAQVRAGATSNAQYHGNAGCLKTGFPYGMDNGSFHDLARESCEKLGISHNQDFNGGETRGFGAFPQTLDRDANVRESSARAYYEPVETRPNLRIIKGTVKRINWGDGLSRKLVAAGFEYADDRGSLFNITAAKEVILSTGTLISPLILESSGVGNPTYVKTKMCIPRCVLKLSLEFLLKMESKQNLTCQELEKASRIGLGHYYCFSPRLILRVKFHSSSFQQPKISLAQISAPLLLPLV
jgi:choline dehydrogenase